MTQQPNQPQNTTTQWIARIVLTGWAGVMILVGACLMVSHWVSLPHPEVGDDRLEQTLASVRTVSNQPKWAAFHFLYGDCPCSRRVLRRVLDQPPHPGVQERIVLIGEDPEMEKKAVELGYEVDCVTPPELKLKYGVESAPFMVVVDPQGESRYSGGYTSRKQGLDVQHAEIIAHLVAGKDVESLPLYGCAVSDSLQAITDPLGLKY